MQGADQVEVKIKAVSDVVKGSNNENIHLALQHYDMDVERTIQAFLEDGAHDALCAWQSTTKTRKNKSREKIVEEPRHNGKSKCSSVESSCTSHASSVENLSASPEPDEEHQIEHTEPVEPVNGHSAPIHDEEHHIQKDEFVKPKPAKHQRPKRIDGRNKRYRTTSERSTSSIDSPVTPTDKKHLLMSIERSQKDLQKHTLALQRLRDVTMEDLEASIKTIGKGFQQLQEVLMKREVELIYAMDTQKQNASSILDKRKKEAEALRLKTISATKMKDSEVNQLKADIKKFTSERKFEEQVRKNTKLTFAVATCLEQIEAFGHVPPVTNPFLDHRLGVDTIPQTQHKGTNNSCTIATQTDFVQPEPSVIPKQTVNDSVKRTDARTFDRSNSRGGGRTPRFVKSQHAKDKRDQDKRDARQESNYKRDNYRENSYGKKENHSDDMKESDSQNRNETDSQCQNENYSQNRNESYSQNRNEGHSQNKNESHSENRNEGHSQDRNDSHSQNRNEGHSQNRNEGHPPGRKSSQSDDRIESHSDQRPSYDKSYYSNSNGRQQDYHRNNSGSGRGRGRGRDYGGYNGGRNSEYRSNGRNNGDYSNGDQSPDFVPTRNIDYSYGSRNDYSSNGRGQDSDYRGYGQDYNHGGRSQQDYNSGRSQKDYSRAGHGPDYNQGVRSQDYNHGYNNSGRNQGYGGRRDYDRSASHDDYRDNKDYKQAYERSNSSGWRKGGRGGSGNFNVKRSQSSVEEPRNNYYTDDYKQSNPGKTYKNAEDYQHRQSERQSERQDYQQNERGDSVKGQKVTKADQPPVSDKVETVNNGNLNGNNGNLTVVPDFDTPTESTRWCDMVDED